MTYTKIQEMIQTSQYDDWLRDETKEILTYKNDLDLQLTISYVKPFNEQWATSFPDKDAILFKCAITYRNMSIETKYLVGIDGLRAIVPLPDIANNLTFKEEDIKLAKLFNTSSNFENYIIRIQTNQI